MNQNKNFLCAYLCNGSSGQILFKILVLVKHIEENGLTFMVGNRLEIPQQYIKQEKD